jgi:Domain of unknown function (DUF3598)
MKLKLFPQHTGIWEGTYTRLSAGGKVLYKHSSRLNLQLNGNRWSQTNEYEYKDGRKEFYDFGCNSFDDNGVLTFDTPRIYGKSWEAGNVILLWWTYKDLPGSLLYENIVLLNEGHRMRTWQHSRNGMFDGVTMIEEWRVKKQEE